MRSDSSITKKLDVYRLAIDDVAETFRIAKN